MAKYSGRKQIKIRKKNKNKIKEKLRNVENLVELYCNLGFSNKEILHVLALQPHVVISNRTL